MNEEGKAMNKDNKESAEEYKTIAKECKAATKESESTVQEQSSAAEANKSAAVNDDASRITVILAKPGEKAYISRIRTSLEALQQIVGGLIELCYPFEDEVCIICNEEGKINGMKPNRALYDEDGRMTDMLFGTIIICGIGGENFTSLTELQQDKYLRRFLLPELLLRVGNTLTAVPYEP